MTETLGVRLDPIGAITELPGQKFCSNSIEKLRKLQEENELLQSSLFALTTHFAQVQFRLRQIAHSSQGDDDNIKALEEFASRGIPDLELFRGNIDESVLSEVLKINRREQLELIGELKKELRSLRRSGPILSKESSINANNQLIMDLQVQVKDLKAFVDDLQKKPGNVQKETIAAKNQNNIFYKSFAILKMFLTIHILSKRNQVTKIKLGGRKNYYWMDLRARLEEAIIKIRRICEKQSNFDEELLNIIRQELAPSLKDLIEYGSASIGSTLVPFVVCIPWVQFKTSQLHAWEIILKYYHLQNGNQYNLKPSRKLSTSFNLNIDIDSPYSKRNELLQCIGNVIAMHKPYRQSYDTHFKAFICAALNANKLSLWLNLIFQSNKVVKMCYFPWSYVAATRFQDSVRSLDTLTKYEFNLDVNLAVKHLENIEDIVG